MKQFSTRNILYVVWFLFYMFLAWFIFGANLVSFAVVFVTYSLSILFSFTSAAEWLLRRLEGARELQTAKERERLEPLFESVYERALEVNPKLYRNIKIHIKDGMEVNAFAMGKTTLTITKGALELMSDEEIQGLIGHELGHFSNGDTVSLLVMLAGNILFSAFFNMLKYIVKGIYWVMQSTEFGKNLKVLWWIFVKVTDLLQFAGDSILMPVSRANEYSADKFAYQCGFGEDLRSALEKLEMLSSEEPMRLVEQLRKTHPPLTSRIQKLEVLEQSNRLTM